MDEIVEQIRATRLLRRRLQEDPQRPRYHLVPPEGFFNDANGALFWRGRYHIFYLARTPIPEPELGEGERWVEVWDHASSADLVHWTFHRPALEPSADGSTPRGIWSGGAVAGAPQPTLIYHVPGQGTCISTSDDPLLEQWKPHPANPVIPQTDGKEYVVFDPCGWYDGKHYYALVGNRNRRAGYEGDSTSLFRSADLAEWEYLGPFYRSRRDWTGEEDAACPDFFALGDRHMLLMHGHKPYFQCHYYLGTFSISDRATDEPPFLPSEHGRMTWPGGSIAGPETLSDAEGRRIFFGWVAEASSTTGSRDWTAAGWASVMSLPRVIELGESGGLRITPAPEVEQLRTDHVTAPERAVSTTPYQLPVAGDCLELQLMIDPGRTDSTTLAVRSTPDREEETRIIADRNSGLLVVDVSRSTLDKSIRYPRYSNALIGNVSEEERYTTEQRVPLLLGRGELLHLRLFLDRSILEIFVNERLCVTQRIYPTRHDATAVRLWADGPGARLVSFDAWSMAPALPW